MTQRSMQRYRLQVLVLVGGALLALIMLILAAAGPSTSCTSAVMAQEPAEEQGPSRDADPGFELSVSPAQRLVRRGFATTYTISVTASSGVGEVSLDVGTLPDGMEHSLDPASLGPPGEATLTLTTTRAAIAGTYRLTVTGTADGPPVKAPFTLTVRGDVFLPAVVRNCAYVCIWPWDEPNDSKTKAIPLTIGSEYSSFICPDDPGDYFSVTLGSPTTLKLRLTNLTNLPPGVDYDLYLFNAAGKLIARSDAYGQVNEQITYDIDQPGDYYILVYPYSGSSSDVPYVLTASTDS